MGGYILRRLAWAGVLFFVVSLVTFVIFFVLPAAPTRAGGLTTNTDAGIRDAFELEGPVYVEYWQFVRGVVVDHSLGRSLSNRRPVTELLQQALPVTLSLVAGGMILMLLISVPVGILSALRPRSLIDRLAMVFVIVGVSAHPAWVGLILAYFFGFKWKLIPLGGYCDVVNPGGPCGGPVQWFTHMVLPWATFSLLFAAYYTRMIRAAVTESLREDFVRTARGKGAPERRVLTRHVLRNAMLPVVTMLGLYSELLLTGIIFIEQVFGLPGLGGMMLEGLRRRDPPLVLGVVVTMAALIVLVNLVIDLLYSTLDPRVAVSTRARKVRGAGTPGQPAPAPLVTS